MKDLWRVEKLKSKQVEGKTQETGVVGEWCRDGNPCRKPSFGALPPEVEPARDLWPELRGSIERQLEQQDQATPMRSLRSQRQHMVWLAAAATAVLVLGLVSFDRRDAGDGGGAAAGATLAAYDEAEEEYVRAADALRDALETRRAQLSPSTMDEIDRNLQIIDDAIERTRVALRQDPASQELAEFHVAMHERKLSLLQAAAWMPADAAIADRRGE